MLAALVLGGGMRNSIRFRAVIISLGIAAYVSGCQTKTQMSVEDAKRVTAELGPQLASVPPRSINGLLVKINKKNRPAPSNCDHRWELSYEQVAERINNLPPVTDQMYSRVLLPEKMSDRQFRAGSYTRAVKLLKMAIDVLPADHITSLSRRYAKLAGYLALAGDYEGAEDAISTSESYLPRNLRAESVRGLHAHLRYWINVGNGSISQAEGDLQDAENYFREAIKEKKEVWEYNDDDNIQLLLANNLMLQGRLLEAETLAREWIEKHSSFGRQIPQIGYAQLSEILYEQGRYNDSEKLASETVRIFRSECSLPTNIHRLKAESVYGKSLVALEKWQEADVHYERLKSDLSSDGHLFGRLFYTDPNYGLTLLQAGRSKRALKLLLSAYEGLKNRLGEIHYKTAETKGFLAIAYAKEGQTQKANSAFNNAVSILLRQQDGSDSEADSVDARDHRLNLILESYMDFLSAPNGGVLTAKEIGVIFKLASVNTNRSVERALAASGARVALGTSELSDIARKEQDAQKQLSALYSILTIEVSRPTEVRNKSMISKLRSGIGRLRSARISLLNQISSKFPKYSTMINPEPVTIDVARNSLRSSEAMIVTYIGRIRTYVWAIPKVGEVAFSVVRRGRQHLSGQVSQLRRALDPQGINTLADIPAFDVTLAHKLYQSLLRPVEKGWKNAKSLLVVADGPLGQLPISLLVDTSAHFEEDSELLFAGYRDIPFLARTHAVTVLPSVAALKALRTTSEVKAKRRPFVGFGDPYFNPSQAIEAVRREAVLLSDTSNMRSLPIKLRSAPQTRTVDSADLAQLPRLPSTAVELRNIAKNLGVDPGNSVFLGKAASENAVKEMKLDDVKVLAFATHGLVPGDLDGLNQPALALSSPKVTNSKGDGLLTMGEILGLRLNADWVVLSACNTAAADGQGAEAVSGLGRAFFYAGAKSLLVSNWPVHSGATTHLTSTLFYLQAKDSSLSRAAALQKTRLEMIKQGVQKDQNGKPVFSYAHPIFWAPFTIVGDGSGAKAGA
jgi:CHAT domain-containing protein